MTDKHRQFSLDVFLCVAGRVHVFGGFCFSLRCLVCRAECVFLQAQFAHSHQAVKGVESGCCGYTACFLGFFCVVFYNGENELHITPLKIRSASKAAKRNGTKEQIQIKKKKHPSNSDINTE